MDKKNTERGSLEKRYGKVSFYAGVIIIPFVIFLLSGEIVMHFLITPRLIPEPPAPSSIDPYQPNPYIVRTRPYFYFHIPGAVYTQARAGYQVQYVINARGFRGPDITVPKTKKRLVVIGDSIVEGHGNDFTKTFSYLLHADFQRTEWEIVNAGVQGASPIYYAANTERYLALQPDAVLIMLYENDLREDRMREAGYFSLPYIDDANSMLTPFSGSSQLLSSFFLAVTRLQRNFFLSPLEGIISRHRNYMKINKEYIPVSGRDPFLISSSLLDGHWRMSQIYLDKLIASFQQHNAQMLITNLSLKSLHPDSSSTYHTYARAVDERVSAWAQERKLPFFSLLPVIRQAFQERDTEEVMIKGDGHPTNETHARIETALYPWLVQNLSR